MGRLADHLKTQTVAQALGLSVSTIKRWVDSGTIQAVRTTGGHRLIPRGEAVRMAHDLGLEGTAIRQMGVGRSGKLKSINDHACDRLCQLLREGEVQQAKSFIQSIYLSGCNAVALADQLIRPVMGRIGHAWMVGALDVYHEHQAAHTVAAAVMDLIDRVSGARKPIGSLALCATTEGDPYVLSCLLGELVLRELGWDVRNLGVNLPLRSLANATLQYRPKLIFLSINYLPQQDQFIREYLSFYETAARNNAAVIVGGQALDAELRSRMRYAAFGDRMIHLAEFARQLGSTTSVTRDFAVSPDQVVPPIRGSSGDAPQ
jgi:MerR family transcriptional regulator, light-induced transcriptional regulator